tara:strand:- start:96 stop:767 length:672 start_codon:yes stop_codon:yes gene_type:complete
MMSQKINALTVGEIHYKYFKDNNIGYKVKNYFGYQSPKTKKFYKNLKLPKKNFLTFLLNLTNRKYLISNSKNINYIIYKHKREKTANLNIIIIKEPLLQFKSKFKKIRSKKRILKYLESCFNKYYKIIKFSFVYFTPFIIVKYEDLFKKDKKDIIFKKISKFMLFKNGIGLNKFYYPTIGNRSFQKSRTIKEDKKGSIILNKRILNIINEDIRTKGLNFIRKL